MRRVSILAGLTTSSSSSAPLSERLSSSFSPLLVSAPDEKGVRAIFETLAGPVFSEQAEDVRRLLCSVVAASVTSLLRPGELAAPLTAPALPPNLLTDVSRVVCGLIRGVGPSGGVDSRDGLLRLWAHEVARVTSDRLPSGVCVRGVDALAEALDGALAAHLESSLTSVLGGGGGGCLVKTGVTSSTALVRPATVGGISSSSSSSSTSSTNVGSGSRSSAVAWPVFAYLPKGTLAAAAAVAAEEAAASASSLQSASEGSHSTAATAGSGNGLTRRPVGLPAFSTGVTSSYTEVTSLGTFRSLVEGEVATYNEGTTQPLKLVFFDDALKHVARLT